jgi:UDP-glucose 4-epimerase
MNIVVTGGSGFIGSHLCDRLVHGNHKVTVVDDFSTGNKLNLGKLLQSPNLLIINGSVLDYESLKPIIRDCDYVFHFAAAVGVFNIINNPLSSLLTNIRGTENVLEAAYNFGIPVFLASSSEVYGMNTSDSLKEGDNRVLGSPTKLRWSYSEAKAIDESIAYAYYVEKQLQTRIVRFFNTVGPRQIGTYGMVLPRFIRAALNNEPINVYGSGEQTRCFVHVYDVIDAVVATAFSDKTIGKILNIGNNFEISINELARKIIKDTGSSSEIVHVSYMDAYGDEFQDMERRVPNIELIKELVGWSPSRDLSTIIKDIISDIDASIKEK